jgi:hypothetical protein
MGWHHQSIHGWFLPKVKVTSLATVELAECLDRCAPNKWQVKQKPATNQQNRGDTFHRNSMFLPCQISPLIPCSSHQMTFLSGADQGQNAALEAAKDGRCAHLLEWFLGQLLVGVSPGTRHFHTLAVAIQDFLPCTSNLHQIYIKSTSYLHVQHMHILTRWESRHSCIFLAAKNRKRMNRLSIAVMFLCSRHRSGEARLASCCSRSNIVEFWRFVAVQRFYASQFTATAAFQSKCHLESLETRNC